jgi:Mg2+/citrate symporter
MIESYSGSSPIADRREGAEAETLGRIAWILDDLIRIPILNIRIGLDPILGLVPWLGDTATAIFSLYLIGSAIYYRLPKVIILRMAMNVAFDYLIGIVPFIGDATDFFIKSNRWNLSLFRQYAQERRKPSLSDYLFVILVIGALIALIAGGIALVFYLLNAIGRNLW